MWQKVFLKGCLREKAFIVLSFIDFLVLRTVLALARAVPSKNASGRLNLRGRFSIPKLPIALK
jgi:hypothetical protein